MNSKEHCFLLIRRSLVRAQVEEPKNKASVLAYRGFFYWARVYAVVQLKKGTGR